MDAVALSPNALSEAPSREPMESSSFVMSFLFNQHWNMSRSEAQIRSDECGSTQRVNYRYA